MGSEITELDQMRAFSVAMSAAINVIIDSQLGLPVSSTHIAIGGIFGVGFLREWLDSSVSITNEIAQEKEMLRGDKKALSALRQELNDLNQKIDKIEQDYDRITTLYRLIDEDKLSIKQAKKTLKEDKKNLYVKREAIKKIITAWLITVPSAAVLAACIFFVIKGLMS